jgi:hypothetical protein
MPPNSAARVPTALLVGSDDEVLDGWELGTMIGAGDGNWDGVSDGDIVGKSVSIGDFVGKAVAVSEGNSDGNSEGNSDKISDENFDGVSEGCFVGNADGVSEGNWDGNWDGVLDGVSEGNSDENSDGTSEFNAEGLLLATEVGSAVDSPLCSSTFTVVAIPGISRSLIASSRAITNAFIRTPPFSASLSQKHVPDSSPSSTLLMTLVESDSYKSRSPRDGSWSNKLESASQPLHSPTNLNNKENKSALRVEGASVGEIVVDDGGLDGSSEAALDGSNVAA